MLGRSTSMRVAERRQHAGIESGTGGQIADRDRDVIDHGVGLPAGATSQPGGAPV